MDDDDVAGEEELAAQNVSMLSYASIHNEERFDDDDMDGGGGGGGGAAHNDSRESAAEVRAHTFVSFSFSSKFSPHLTFPSLSPYLTFFELIRMEREECHSCRSVSKENITKAGAL
jgi:hypothetical protein